jgi:hypothetical protein
MGSANNFHCPDRAAILRELVDAPLTDAEKLKQEWLATGRDLEEVRVMWLQSMANDDSVDVTATYYPRTPEVRRRRLEHEALTGHSVLALRGLFRQNL